MPARLRLALVAAATLVLVGALLVVLLAPTERAVSTDFQGARSPDVPPLDFTLTDQDGKRVATQDLRGRPIALTFLYTTCETECPTVATTVRSALDEAGVDVPVLAVSVDPENDTAQRARRFLESRRLRGRMRFLLGSREELAPIWRDYGIQEQGDGFEHSARVVLLDGRGRQRVAWPISALTTEGLASDLRLLAQGPPPA
jgi:protein SCO1